MNNYKKLDISFLNNIKCELPELKNSDITNIDSFSDGSNGVLTKLVSALQLAIDVKELITKLSDKGVPPPSLDINNEAVCLTFKNGNICIYIEYYFDGDIWFECRMLMEATRYYNMDKVAHIACDKTAFNNHL